MPPRPAVPIPDPRVDVLQQQVADLSAQIAQLMPLLAQQAAGARDPHQIAPRGRHATNALRREHPLSLDPSSDDEVPVDNPFAPLARRADDAHRWESAFKIDLPDFHGNLAADEFLDWIAAVDEILDYKDVPSDRRVALVCTRLRGRAAAWWQQLKLTRTRQGKERIHRWDKFIKHLRAEFLPFNYSRILYQRLQHLRQGTRTVNEYIEEFYQLLVRNNLSETTDQSVSLYIGGLRLQFQDMLNLFSPDSISEAHQRAILLEQQFARRPTGHVAATQPRLPAVPSAPDTRTGPGRGSAPPIASRLPPTVAPSNCTRPGACFACGELGHQRASCPRLGRGLLVGEVVDDPLDEPPVYDDEMVPEETLPGDVGQALVLRHACLTPKQLVDQVQRHHLFESTCTIGGKICRFIIDSGACENVIATEAVTKLALKPELHPQPYSLAWLKKGTNVTVDHRVLVHFSIGPKYCDSVWCDVVPMDACHLLLGRPWQFDRSVIHDGRSNTYSFLFEGVKFVLIPSLPSTPSAPQEPQVLLLHHADFMREIRHAPPIFLLLPTDVEHSPIIPPPVSSLLQEFSDIFPDNLPAGLPPLRDIQHHIDLIPGAPLPNRPHYRMSPAEHEELRRQVEELVHKGLVRRSLSPCAVPALLIPKKTGEWRMCCDSRAINKITVRYRFPIPRLDDLLDQLSGAILFRKLDLRSGYHQIRI